MLSSTKRSRSERDKITASEAVLGLRRDLLNSALCEAHAQLVSGYPAFSLLPLYASTPGACPFTQLHNKFSWHSSADGATVEVRAVLCCAVLCCLTCVGVRVSSRLMRF